MVRECEHRTGLRPAARSVIDTVVEAHKLGSGNLQLDSLLDLFAELPATEVGIVKQRGQVLLTKADAMSGTFENKGDPLELKVSVLKVHIPALVQGHYVVFPDPTIRFSYNAEYSIVMSVGVGFLSLKTEIEDITISPSRVDVDLSGLAPDKCFILT